MRDRTSKILLASLLSVMLCLGLNACGRKGDLVLPETVDQSGDSNDQKARKEQTERPAQ